MSPIGTTPVALLHAATAVPNHMASELQDLHPPVGLSVDASVEDGAFILGDAPGAGITIDEETITAITGRPGTRSADSPAVRPARAGLRLLAEAHGPHLNSSLKDLHNKR